MTEKTDRNYPHTIATHAMAVSTIVAAVVGVMTAGIWYTNITFTNTARYIALIHGIYWVTIIYLIWFILTRKSPDFLGIPRIRTITDDDIIIVENSPWLGMGIAVAMYEAVDEVERLICYGEVTNVQTNGLVQISVRADGEINSVVGRIKSNKRDILIRPGLYRGTTR